MAEPAAAPFLQRNPGPYPVDIPAIPATVPPGGTVAWHLPITGFEPVPDDTPPPAAEPAAPAKTSRRAAAPADTPKDGEQA